MKKESNIFSMASEISAQNSSMTSLSFLSAYSWIFFSGSSRRAISPAETKGKIENHFFKKEKKRKREFRSR